MKYRVSSHNKQDCRYHIVWITKYRRECLSKWIQDRLRVVLGEICGKMYINVLKLWMEEDHVHIYISIPVSQYIPHVVKKLKGISSKVIREEFKNELSEYFWNPVLRAVGYFVCTVWEINDKIIKQYIEEQWKEDILQDGFDV